MAIIEDRGQQQPGKYGKTTTQSPEFPTQRLSTPGPYDVPVWDDGGYAWGFEAQPYQPSPMDVRSLGLQSITEGDFESKQQLGVDDLFAGKQLSAAGSTKGMYPAFSAALAKANAAMKAAGLGTFSISSGFRTREEQQRLYDKYKNGTGNLAAKPGTSKHESGLAVDINWSQLNSRQRAWLRENLPKFGIMNSGMRFSQPEPWHWSWGGV